MKRGLKVTSGDRRWSISYPCSMKRGLKVLLNGNTSVTCFSRISMKRGLKEFSPCISSLYCYHLNEKRIESSISPFRSMATLLFAQWKEDWKYSSGAFVKPFTIVTQWKEDWKSSTIPLRFILPLLSMKRGLKVYFIHFKQILFQLLNSMKRGLKVPSSKFFAI